MTYLILTAIFVGPGLLALACCHVGGRADDDMESPPPSFPWRMDETQAQFDARVRAEQAMIAEMGRRAR